MEVAQGHANNANGITMNGGNGGGIILLKSPLINSTGYKIIANGSDGAQCDSVIASIVMMEMVVVVAAELS